MASEPKSCLSSLGVQRSACWTVRRRRNGYGRRVRRCARRLGLCDCTDACRGCVEGCVPRWRIIQGAKPPSLVRSTCSYPAPAHFAELTETMGEERLKAWRELSTTPVFEGGEIVSVYRVKDRRRTFLPFYVSLSGLALLTGSYFSPFHGCYRETSVPSDNQRTSRERP